MESIMISGDQLTVSQFSVIKDLLAQEENSPSKKVALQYGGLHLLINGYQVGNIRFTLFRLTVL